MMLRNQYPEKIEPPCTQDEIKNTCNKLENNMATGIDNLHAKFVRYGPDELQEQIAQIINNTTDSTHYPKVLRQGMLTPVTKPPKKIEQGNFQLVILLSVPQKVTTIILIDNT